MTDRRDLPGLTIHQPWAWMISVGLKVAENRDWPPPPQVIGHYMAIHAGKTVNAAAYEKLAREPRKALWAHQPVPAPEELVLGAVVAVARVAGAAYVEGDVSGMRLEVQRIVGRGLTMERAREVAASKYAVGPILWVLEDVFRLPNPIPCRGAQKIWDVPDPVAEAVRAQWAAAHPRSATP